MFHTTSQATRLRARFVTAALGVTAIIVAALPMQAQALPVYARQTGQNCIACHAGGQFPELTSYGRLFKLTGYTIGQRTTPVSVMGLLSASSIANAPPDTAKHGEPIFATGSLFLAGKITENMGAFTQVTYDNYAVDNGSGSFSGHTQVDNVDIRYADHIFHGKQDFIYGVSLNNNPSITDPWNSAAAWMQYVPVPSPSSSQFIDGAAPYPGFASGGNIAGLNAYLFWNRTLYAEVGTYRTADKMFSLLSTGVDPRPQLSGSNNPYWRLALSHDWGPHSVMVGTSGMVAHIYDDPADISDSATVSQFRNTGIDAQYQYILDPHTVTAQVAYMQTQETYSDTASAGLPNPGSGDTNNVTRAKLSYVYAAKYGGSLSYFNLTGSTNNQSDPYINGITYEAFWIPKQNIRMGAQYTTYHAYQGATSNYDGTGRNPGDNNSVFLYAWFAY